MEKLLSLLKNIHGKQALLEHIFPFGAPKEILNNLVFVLKDSTIKDVNIRANALELVHEFDKDLCKEILINYLHDEDSILRMEACGILSFYLPEEKISQNLENTLRSDLDVDVRLVAVFALKKAGMLSAIKALEWAKENDIEENWESRSPSHYADDAIRAIKLRMES